MDLAWKLIMVIGLIGCTAGQPDTCPLPSGDVTCSTNSSYWVAPLNGAARGCAEDTPECPSGWVCGGVNDAGRLVIATCP